MGQSKISHDSDHLLQIIDAIPTAIVMVDELGKIKLINKQTERLFGYTAAELLEETIHSLVPHKFRHAHPSLVANYINHPEARLMGQGRDLYALRKDGTEFPVEIGLNPIKTAEGTFTLGAIVDISERKRLESRFRATIESAPLAMVMVDQVGSIVLVNKETESLFGYERHELLSKKIEVLIPQRFRKGHPGMRVQYFSSPSARRMGEGRELFALRKDGTEFPVEIGLNPVWSDDGFFVLSAIVDISDRKKHEVELQQLNEQLEKSNVELQRFAYVASHDLQSPLRSISSFMQLVKDTYTKELPEDANDWLDRSLFSAKQMELLIRDLLDYSKINAGVIKLEPIDLRSVVDDVLSLLNENIEQLQPKILCDAMPTVMGNRIQLTQLMQNLVSNAFKYHSDRPIEVSITAKKNNNNEWVISVQDNGIGIESKYFPKIFEVFQRLHDQTEYAGTGVGLAICRSVVERHGGKLYVESEFGKGSTFYFTLKDITHNGN